MIDPISDKLIPLGKITKGGGQRVSIPTAYRWVSRGIRGRRLETVLCGGRRYTSETALREFFSSLTPTANPHSPPSLASRQRQVRSAEVTLERAGI